MRMRVLVLGRGFLGGRTLNARRSVMISGHGWHVMAIEWMLAMLLMLLVGMMSHVDVGVLMMWMFHWVSSMTMTISIVVRMLTMMTRCMRWMLVVMALRWIIRIMLIMVLTLTMMGRWSLTLILILMGRMLVRVVMLHG
jgi:hypothetical protein